MKKRLQLTVYDPQRDVLAQQLTLSIPHAPPDGQRKAATRGFRLYLFNDSGRMARYIQVQLCVRAVFLAYPYHRFPPLLIEPADRWEVDRLGDDVFRCFLEGGADLVCHPGRPYDLGYVNVRVPHGEADGGVVSVEIRYEIAAEDHQGSGLLTVLLQAEGTPSGVHRDEAGAPVASAPLARTTVFDMRGQTVGTQVNVAGDYVDQRPSGTDQGGPAPADADAESLRRQLAQARDNLRLIEEREAEYVLGTDVPLHLVKEKQRLQQRLTDLEVRLGARDQEGPESEC